MSWNKYCIVVNNIQETDLIRVVDLIGYGEILTPSSEIDFRTAFNNRGDEMPFGLFDNCLWILSPNQVEKFFLPEQSVLEKNLVKKFPNSTILALEENSTVDSFGFTLIKDGKRIRVLSGSDSEYNFEYGEPIEEEINCYKQVVEDFDEDEKQEIIANVRKRRIRRTAFI